MTDYRDESAKTPSAAAPVEGPPQGAGDPALRPTEPIAPASPGSTDTHTYASPPVGSSRARRFGVLRYVALCAISLAVGSALTLAADRWVHPRASSQSNPASSAAEAMPGMPGMAPGTPQRPSGVADSAVYISPERQQLIGVRTGFVEDTPLESILRVTATIAYDETRVTEIHPKVSGWVEQLYVDFVGKPVRAGQALFSLYSPELVTAQNDLKIAKGAQASLGSRSSLDARAGAAALEDAARSRLRRWDISERTIDELERSGAVRKTMTLSAPFAGVVLERNTYRGQYVTPETATFKIGDLSKVWVIGQLFEYELDRVKVGQSVSVEFPYGQSSTPLEGKIDFVYPDVDPQTRRLKVRATFDNPGLALKPQTYVTLVIRGELAPELTVPREAVIDTGERSYVILARPNGYFEPRDVKLGAPVGDRYPVLGGVQAGDRVVTSAQFLVDSETNLQSAMQSMSMSMPGMGGDQQNKTPKPAPKPASSSPAPRAPATEGKPSGPPPPPRPPASATSPKTTPPEMPDMPGMPGMSPTKDHGAHGTP